MSDALIRGSQERRRSPETDRIIALVLDPLDSGHSRRAYRRALIDFLDW
jgi:hypothetical protein